MRRAFVSFAQPGLHPAEREKLTAGLARTWINVTESETNFILFRAPVNPI
jgi:histidinol-phosphate/aromatic aminotransferase/cobyric acid decarboxylase-like protein